MTFTQAGVLDRSIFSSPRCERSSLFFHGPAGAGENHLTSQRQQGTSVFGFQPSAHTETHDSQGGIRHRRTKWGKRPSAGKARRPSSPALALEGNWGKGVGRSDSAGNINNSGLYFSSPNWFLTEVALLCTICNEL